jgi:hypothetical protein
VASYGIISQEPGTTLDLSTSDDLYLDFDIVAKALGCNYGDDAEAELNCMRMLSWVQIEEFINRYQGTPPISFMEYIRQFSRIVLILDFVDRYRKQRMKDTSFPTRLYAT